MAFTLPPLPYAYDSLAPYMSKETLEFHHDKHHNAYVTVGNTLAGDGTKYAGKSIEAICVEAFAAKFKDKTGNKWDDRASFAKKPGKHNYVEMSRGADDQAKDGDPSTGLSSLRGMCRAALDEVLGYLQRHDWPAAAP